MKYIAQIILMALMALSVHAEQAIFVSGYVFDALMHMPISTASIAVISIADSTVVASATSSGRMQRGDNIEYTGAFYLNNLPRKHFILQVSNDGYESQTLDLDLSKSGKRQLKLNLDPIYLTRERRHELNEVTVTATKVKFYNRGDTIVYNADAFQLAEGSMLDALIEQLPGVTLDENGVIKVNGRTVESLILNGKDFFNGNKELMLKNIDSYMVKNVEVYNKAGFRSEIAGTDIGDGRYVMDVKLKREYMMGINMNTEAGYGSDDRYLGRIFAMGFTPTAQISAFFNANNLNESQKPQIYSRWTPEEMPTGVTRTLAGGVDYNVTPNDRWTFRGSASATHTHETDGTDIVQENYLSGGNTYAYRYNRLDNRHLALETDHAVEYKRPGHYGMQLKPYFRYNHRDDLAEDVSAELNATFNDMTMEFLQNIYAGNGSAALGNLINRRIETDRVKGHSLNVGGTLMQTFNIPRTSDLLSIEVYGGYDNRHDERFNHFDINFGADPVPTDVANRYYKNYPQFHSNIGAQAKYSLIINKGLSFDFGYAFEHHYSHETSSLFNLEENVADSGYTDGKLPSAIQYLTGFDRDNSYISRETTNRHKLYASISIWQNYNESDRFWMQYRFPLYIDQQRLHYTRGDINETLTRTSAVMDFGNMFIQTGNDNHGFWLNWDLKSLKPDMVSMVDFTDATNPLFIRKGNPDLKNALRFLADMSYKFSFGHKLRNQLMLGAQFDLTDNALSYGYTYDSATGIRTGSYHNVKGNLGGSGEIRYTFDANGFRITNSLQGGRRTNVDLVGYDSPTLTRNKVYDLNFSDEIRFSYSFGNNRVSANFSGINNRFSSNPADFTDQNTWTFRSGVSLLYNLPANFQISTDFTVFNRRGYTDAALNSDNFIWNARLTYKALKGQLLLMLDGYDILHDLSNVSYTMNAQARTETIRTVLPRYFMFHLQWRFNHIPKKKK
jgi:hypothetical protein